MQANRRQVFAALLAAAAARHVNAADDIAIPGKRPMILHNDRPEDLETPVKYFDSWVTPIDAFFVRQHLPRPAAVDPAAYRLNLTGLVSRQRQVTLADLEKLPQHTLPAAAKFLEIDGADTPVMQTPDFVRSMPMEKALHPATLLALKMNGQSPDIHGLPARLIVPGWDGTSWVKWVVRLTPVAKESGGFFMNPGYRYPKYHLP